MSETFDRESIAHQRIPEGAERRSGFVDLGGLGLTALPPQQLRRSARMRPPVVRFFGAKALDR
jgi:hypothetical protein